MSTGFYVKIHKLCIGLAVFTSVLAAQPKLALDKLDIDLGAFYSGDIRTGKVRISNIGTDTLRIYSVKPQCGCTTVKQPKTCLPPKQSDVIEVEFNSALYHGSIEKHVTISSNDPTSPSVDFRLHGEAREDLEPEDSNIWLGIIRTDSVTTRILTYRNKSGKPLTVHNVISSAPALQLKWEKTTLNPDEKFFITINFKPVKTGINNEYIWLETDSKHQPRIESRISYVGKK
jgi:hypothetical protein